VREVFEEAVFPGLSREPFSPRAGYVVDQLRKLPKGWKGKVWSAHVGMYRALYIVEGSRVRIGTFGYRPGFYKRLRKLSALFAEWEREPPSP
jgi:hypothetical protein